MKDCAYLGVDWSSGSWVAVGYGDYDTPLVDVYDDIEGVWIDHEGVAERIVVDVPIGLCETRESDDCRCEETDGELSRMCDDIARSFIGPRSSSVFTAPCQKAARMAAGGEPYETVNEANRDATGKGLMRQAANIAEGIVAVEDLLLDGEGDPETLVEGHPEVCFRAFNGEPLQHSKKSAAGVAERLSVLDSVPDYTSGDWRALAEELRDEHRRVDLDDLLDAMVLGLTARAPEEELWTLPRDPPTDHEGLPMQMVYRGTGPWSDPYGT